MEAKAYLKSLSRGDTFLVVATPDDKRLPRTRVIGSMLYMMLMEYNF